MSTYFLKNLNSFKVALMMGYVCISLEATSPLTSHAHGGGGGDPLEVGEFRTTPLLVIEGHGGFENNLEGNPKHYGLDTLLGVVMEWGLENNANFSIEAGVGPVLVWGEAEHFYGAVHEEEGHDDHGDDHDTEYKRIDVRGLLKFKYAANDRVSFAMDAKPYYVTKSQGEEKEGTKNEIGVKGVFELGDGDVDFALGDQITDIIDGTYLSVEHRQGWEPDGHWQGAYTDPRVGVGFALDLVGISFEAGPRFYSPKSDSELSNRIDFASELEVSRPIGDKAELFIHWQPTFSKKDGHEWGEGWQHHLGTGVVFRF